ncbi:bile acid receptor-like isoform X2 [Ornithorhynchus anatinus]|uniref:bile acid receptor-like isoform X2 n=1 Tax=Ornithorhynchus anatinus TaxID=9258 RepID=UPI0010A8B947|nr:bile acid receptor-like isoform X2 [Ornithorhynchus anatinus]
MKQWKLGQSMANTYVTVSDGYCLSEPIQYYDVMPEHINYQLQDSDFQAASYCQYSTVQFPPGLQTSSSQSHYNTYSLDTQYGDGQYVLSACELNKPTCMVAHEGFFRRSITKNAVYRCKNGGHCEMDMYMRRKCQECRLKKCKAVGMLAECLLTEVQCKSKRLRKNLKQKGSFFCNIKVEDEGADNKHVSSTTRSGKIQERVELTPGEHQLIDHIVAAHQKYTIPLEEAKKFLQESANPEESFLHLSETAVLHVQVLVDFTKRLPGFESLANDDQIALLKGSTVEAMFLRSAQIYNQRFNDCPSSAHENAVRFSEHALNCHIPGYDRNVIYSIDTSHSEESPTSTTTSGITEEFITALFYFYRSMGELNITETEYALLSATTVFFSDRPLLKNKQHVEKLQEPLLGILYKYSKIYHPEDPQHFARLIGRLTELRTLNHNHSEVLITWKTKDPKLTSLLCEIWDLH